MRRFRAVWVENNCSLELTIGFICVNVEVVKVLEIESQNKCAEKMEMTSFYINPVRLEAAESKFCDNSIFHLCLFWFDFKWVEIRDSFRLLNMILISNLFCMNILTTTMIGSGPFPRMTITVKYHFRWFPSPKIEIVLVLNEASSQQMYLGNFRKKLKITLNH